MEYLGILADDKWSGAAWCGVVWGWGRCGGGGGALGPTYTHYLLLTSYYNSLTTDYSLYATYCLLLTTHYLLLTTY